VTFALDVNLVFDGLPAGAVVPDVHAADTVVFGGLLLHRVQEVLGEPRAVPDVV